MIADRQGNVNRKYVFFAAKQPGTAFPAIPGFRNPNEPLLDFVFAVRDDSTSIVVVKYNGTASTLTVPSTVAGLPVVEIGAQAFEGNTKLKSVTLPATIEIIGRRAFAECKNLLEVK